MGVQRSSLATVSKAPSSMGLNRRRSYSDGVRIEKVEQAAVNQSEPSDKYGADLDDLSTASDEQKSVNQASERWDEVKEFLEAYRQEKVLVAVEFCEVRKSLFKGKTPYFNITIALGEREYSCKRRYSEFVTLIDCLRSRVKGACVPPLKKKGIGNETDSVQNTINGLKAFLEALVRHPFLKNDDAFLYFLTSVDKFKPKYLANLRDLSSSPGVCQWNKLIELCKTPAKPLHLLKLVSNELACLRSFYRNFRQAVKTHIARLETYAAGVNEFGNAFDTWKLIEGMELPMLAGVVGNEEGSTSPRNVPISNMVSKIEETCMSQGKELMRKAKALAQVINGPLTFEAMVLDNLKDEIKATRDSINRYKKASKRYKDARETFNAKCVVQGDEQVTVATPDKLKTNLEVLKEARSSALKEAHFMVRAFLVVEIQRFRHERANRVAEILRQVSELNYTFAKSMNKMWESASSNIPSTITGCSDIRVLEAIKENDHEGALLKRADSSEAGAGSLAYQANRNVNREEEDTSEVDSDSEDEAAAVQTRGGNSRRKSIRAVQNFDSVHETELTVQKGTVLEGVISEENPEWVWTTDLSTGNEGYVPTSMVEIIDEDPDTAVATTVHAAATVIAEQPSTSVVEQPNNVPLDPVPEGTTSNSQRPTQLLAGIQGFNKGMLRSA